MDATDRGDGGSAVAAYPFLFGTNLKMHQTAAESVRFFADLNRIDPPAGCRLFVIPPFTSLPAVAELARREGSPIWVGAQNMHWEREGAYTGEVSAPMLAALGVDLVLLGHAERRTLFHETDVDLNRKARAAVAAGLRVLFCVGETAEEHGFGVGPETVSRQLKIGLHGLEPSAAARLQIAYEPVWSIGADGVPAHADDVVPIAARIGATLRDRFGAAGAAVPVLYGGSVNPENAAEFSVVAGIGGLFVGRSAWTVDGFRATLTAVRSWRDGIEVG